MIGLYKSIVEPIIEQVKRDSERIAVTIIADDNTEERITIGRLHREAVSFALELQSKGIEKQDIVVIALNHSSELISTFFGILYAGAVPTIYHYPEHVFNLERYKQQIHDLVENTDAQGVVTIPEIAANLNKRLLDLNCCVIEISANSLKNSDRDIPHPKNYTSGEQLAYIQYTSGSTGLQKGVLLSHRAILNLIPSYTKAIEILPEDVIINWPPLYHDLGLFSGLIVPITIGISSVLISPFKWVRNPKAFLKAIHKHGGTHCAFPNFGLNHTLRSVRNQDLDGLDLCNLRWIGLGGEPILYDSLKNFFDFFKSFGLKKTALKPGYGMAENTLAATVNAVDEQPPIDWVDVRMLYDARHAIPASPHGNGSIPVVSCGLPLDGVKILVVDSDRNTLPERSVGEIVIRSDFLFSGYHLNPELTSRVLDDGWYSTGDIGYLAKGHLYVCGRKKDLIIIGGRNIHPEDLEAVANTIPGIKPGRAVAFGIKDDRFGSEKIVMVCELRSNIRKSERINVDRELRRRVVHELHVNLNEVHFAESGWIKKTYNGRMIRSANSEKYKKTVMKHH